MQIGVDYQHAGHPVAAGATNPVHDVVAQNGQGTVVRDDQGALVTEKAPVPETVPGGRYVNAAGVLVDANGTPIEG